MGWRSSLREFFHTRRVICVSSLSGLFLVLFVTFFLYFLDTYHSSSSLFSYSLFKTPVAAYLEIRDGNPKAKGGKVVDIPLSHYFPGTLEKEGRSPFKLKKVPTRLEKLAKDSRIRLVAAENSETCDFPAVESLALNTKSRLDYFYELILITDDSNCDLVTKVDLAARAGYRGIVIYPSLSQSEPADLRLNKFTKYVGKNSHQKKSKIDVAFLPDHEKGQLIREKYCHPYRFWADMKPHINFYAKIYGYFKDLFQKTKKVRVQTEVVVLFWITLAILLFTWCGLRRLEKYHDHQQQRERAEWQRLEDEFQYQQYQSQSHGGFGEDSDDHSQSEEGDDTFFPTRGSREVKTAEKIKRCREALDLPGDPEVKLTYLEIMKAYRKKALSVHPDKFPRADPTVLEQKTREFTQLQKDMEYLVKIQNRQSQSNL